MCGHTRDPIIYSKFHRNPFRGFGAPGGQNLAFPITLASRFYNSLYYRTSRDLPVLTKRELGLPFPPRNLRIKFGANPSTICLVIVVTDRQTDRLTDTHTHTHTQTNAGENICPRFRGDNN